MSTIRESVAHPAQTVRSAAPLDPAGPGAASAPQEDLESVEAPAAVAIPAGPEELRALPDDALPGLARQMRRQLVEITSRTGGHLGPNLGVVELTIAMHRELQSPHEAIVFDTGHQAYVHKMLTGRADLTGLRSAEGVSGYPDRGESVHDVVENSHASGSVAWAHGIDRARRLAGEPGVSAAVIGDGALTGGVGLEALNELASDIGSRTIVVLNDNTRSYAPTVGGLARHLQALRERAVPAGTDVFTALGLTYLGPIDGHDHGALAEALVQARRAAEDPSRSGVVMHVVTRKGAGFARAEADARDHWHSTGPFEIEQPLVTELEPAAAPPAADTWTSRLGAAVLDAARGDERVIALSAAMVDPVGLTAMQRELPSRVIDVGIAEQLALDTAAGLSRGGAKPVVALYATFLNRAYDQLLLDVALHREDVTLTLDRAGVTGDDGPSHHGIWDLSLACQIPGISVWAPRDGEQLSAVFPRALAMSGPSLVRFPKGACPPAIPTLARHEAGDVLAGDPHAPIDVLVLSIGALADRAVEAARAVSSREPAVNVVVLDPVQALPLCGPLLDLAASAGAVVSVEDGVAERGIGAAVAVRLAQGATRSAPAPAIRTLGVAQGFIAHGKRDAILAAHGLDATGIARAIGTVLG
ncbi:1-deoxy-D-xylulose-5-phosphate synthase [Brachybacterium sp. FME24]|uniref:1-deoxy-D-xylulose-5-phosphate synthase n=1 Tax=Brachybacterium sp. FME24 TaxID=2742605 RepID=UPI00271485DA|nr:1-deoxy-D-xylulose-5-phosphate synthase [Brachybacterium sp. FME24]